MTDDDLHRAFEYPYRRPSGGFVFDTATGMAEPLHRWDEAGRTPVLAIGSNAAPEQLARKFDPAGRWGTVPVTTARLVDHDVVFAARLTAYGACPATFVRCEHVAVRVHVTWLTAAQLEHMDRSEGVHTAPPAYRRVELASVVEFDPIGGPEEPPRRPAAYQATAGALRLGPTPFAVAAIPAERRAWPGLGQRDVLARLAAFLGAGDAETVARTAVGDAATRRAWNRALARASESATA